MNSIFSTAYAAPIGYYQAFIQSDDCFIETHENFVKQTIRNRCRIATSNGIQNLIIPISGSKNHIPISDIKICYKTNWQRQHIKALETAYKSSPFFEYYADELALLYTTQPRFLCDWNLLVHNQITKWLGLKKEFSKTKYFEKVIPLTNDLRNYSPIQNKLIIYYQVFEMRTGFLHDLSIYDLLFNCGNTALNLILEHKD